MICLPMVFFQCLWVIVAVYGVNLESNSEIIVDAANLTHKHWKKNMGKHIISCGDVIYPCDVFTMYRFPCALPQQNCNRTAFVITSQISQYINPYSTRT